MIIKGIIILCLEAVAFVDLLKTVGTVLFEHAKFVNTGDCMLELIENVCGYIVANKGDI